MAVLLDSSCSHHLMGTKAVFVDMAASGGVKHVCGFNGALQPVEGCGTVALQGEAGKRFLIPDVLYVSGIQANMLSFGQLKENRVQLQGDGNELLLVAATGEVLDRARYTRRVLCTNLRPYSTQALSTEVVALRTIVSATKSTLDPLHARLAHVGVDTIKSSAKHEVTTGLDISNAVQRVLDLTDNKVVTSIEVIFYETLSLGVWKAKYGLASGRTQAHPSTDNSTVTVPLLAEVNEPADEDVVEVLTPPPVLSSPSPIADRPASTPVSATGEEGSLGASPVAPASGIAGGQQGAKLEAAAGVQSTGEQQTGRSTGELSKSTGGKQPVEGSKQLVDDEDVDEEGEMSAGEESTDSDVVEVPIKKPELQHTGRARRPPERLSFHACLPPAAFTTVYDEVIDNLVYDEAKEDEELPELDPDMHADPEHRWDITTMTVKEALASWKGEAMKADMDEEIHSLIGMGTWELVERPRGVNIMKNRWVLTTKYCINDTVECEKARLVVKGFTQVYGADYEETYLLVSSYVTLRIFLSIVAILDLNMMQLDMKNAFLQSKLDWVLYMYQPDYFDDGTSRVCKLLKSLYELKQSPLLWYRTLDIDDLLVASNSTAMQKELKELLEAAFELREISPVAKYLGLEIVRDMPARKLWLHQQNYADKLRRCFIDEEQPGHISKTPVSIDAYAKLTFDDEEMQEREEEYRQKVGSLQFTAMTTRPNIAFACSKLGSGLTVRSDQYWREVRCLAYLADTRDTALEFGGGPWSLELIAYVDADDAGDKQNRTITPIVLRVDNKSAITVAQGLGLTGSLKHMEQRYAWLQHMVRRGKFTLKYIPTTEQPADFMTKALHFPDFNRCSVTIG
ncbi:unnamed protein product [Closterium sp. NIES-53]